MSILTILANIIVLGLIHDGASNEFDSVIEKLNLAFFTFFVFELGTKLFGYGFKHYIRDRFNWFDGGVILVSAIDITL